MNRTRQRPSIVAKPRGRSLRFEALEPRQVLAASFTASLGSTGVLKVTGSDADDRFFFSQTDGKISIKNLSKSWSASKVKSISINLKGGNDYVTFNSTANGGNQLLQEKVTVKSGDGDERVRVPGPHDVYFSGQGHSLTIATDGTVTLDGTVCDWSDDTSPDVPDNSSNNTTNWFDTNIQNAALRSLGSSYYADGTINRSDMLGLFNTVQQSGAIDSTELADLQLIVNTASLFGEFDYVRSLASYVVLGNTANAKYQGQTLGNLAVGSSATQLDKLVDKWFLGTDHPLASGYSYRQVSGTLFVGGALYTDVRQGYLGDCYLLASLGELAYRNPNAINSMFIVNGDGTYTVRFYRGSTAEYVTVDQQLPTNGSYLVFASLGAYATNSGNELWVALAEKAYVQINEMGWLRSGLPGNGQNSYDAIAGGYIYAAINQITGQSTFAFASTTGGTSFNTFVAAFNAGKLIGFASKSSPSNPSLVVGGHAYAVVGYNAATQKVQLFNPWGLNNGHDSGVIELSWSQVEANFSYFDRTA